MLFIDKATAKEPIISGEYLVELKPVQTSIFDSTIGFRAQKDNS